VKDNVRQREKRGWDEIAFRLGIELRRGIRGTPGVLPTLGALNSEEEDAGRGRGGCGGGESINNDIMATVDMERTKRRGCMEGL
jgi:hypothetical protein